MSNNAKRAGLTPTLIADAALALLDEGSDRSALTMRSLGSRLGVQAPSLYAHISGIDEVIDLVHARINDDIDISILTGSHDSRDLRAFAHAYRDAYRAHPVAATIIVSRTINQDHALRIYEEIARFLTDYGLPPVVIMPVMALFDSLILGSAVEPFAEGFDTRNTAQFGAHPALAAALKASDHRHIDDFGFDLGLDAFFAQLNLLATR